MSNVYSSPPCFLQLETLSDPSRAVQEVGRRRPGCWMLVFLCQPMAHCTSRCYAPPGCHTLDIVALEIDDANTFKLPVLVRSAHRPVKYTHTHIFLVSEQASNYYSHFQNLTFTTTSCCEWPAACSCEKELGVWTLLFHSHTHTHARTPTHTHIHRPPLPLIVWTTERNTECLTQSHDDFGNMADSLDLETECSLSLPVIVALAELNLPVRVSVSSASHRKLPWVEGPRAVMLL